MNQKSETEIGLDNKNKAIAEFAGWKLEPINDDEDDDEGFYWFCKYNERGERIITWNGEEAELLGKDSTIPYNLDWSWLVPVIEQIEELGYKFKICRKRCQICLDDKEEDFFVDIKLDSKLKSAHEAVYQFVESMKEMRITGIKIL